MKFMLRARAKRVPNEPSSGRSRLWWSCALIALALIGGGSLLLPGSRKVAQAATPPAAATVSTAQVRTAQWPETLSAMGAIEPWQEAVIGSQSGGLRLVEVRASIGDTVRRGELLARFDSRMLRAEEAQLLAALAQARANAAQAQVNRLRARRQQEGGGISEQEVLASDTQSEVTAAQVAATLAQLDGKRVQLADAEVRAPDDGVISARSATLGAVAGSGQELFRLIRQGRLEWRGELTAAQLGRVAPGQQIELSLPQGQRATAQVRQQAPSLDSGTRLGLLYADLRESGAARPGMYARGSVVTRQSPALVVPAASIVIRDGRSYAFTLRGEGDTAGVRMTAVTPGRRQGAEVEVLDGVAEGTPVVVAGAGFLDDGDTVRVANAAEAPAAAPRAAR